MIEQDPNEAVQKAITYTDDEIAGVERYFNVKWDELSDVAKMMKGMVYRYTLSPKAIADMLLTGKPKEAPTE